MGAVEGTAEGPVSRQSSQTGLPELLLLLTCHKDFILRRLQAFGGKSLQSVKPKVAQGRSTLLKHGLRRRVDPV